MSKTNFVSFFFLLAPALNLKKALRRFQSLFLPGVMLGLLTQFVWSRETLVSSRLLKVPTPRILIALREFFT